MRSIQNKNNEWKKIDKIILRVDNVNLIFLKNETIIFDCGFENISRGRCKLSLNKKEKNLFDNLFIHTDKALMEVNIFYEPTIQEKILRFFSYKKNSTKKVKIMLGISDSLMINNTGDLYIKDKTEIKVDSISWNIPIL